MLTFLLSSLYILTILHPQTESKNSGVAWLSCDLHNFNKIHVNTSVLRDANACMYLHGDVNCVHIPALFAVCMPRAF